MGIRLRVVVAAAALFAAFACVGVSAQSVVNTLSRPPAQKVAAKPAAVTIYDPATPPAANAPIVVAESQAAIAEDLAMLTGETNEQYTQRMKLRYDATRTEFKRVTEAQAAKMRALAASNRR